MGLLNYNPIVDQEWSLYGINVFPNLKKSTTEVRKWYSLKYKAGWTWIDISLKKIYGW